MCPVLMCDVLLVGMTLPGMSLSGMTLPGMFLPGMSLPGMTLPGGTNVAALTHSNNPDSHKLVRSLFLRYSLVCLQWWMVRR